MANERSVSDEIEALRAKISLLEGDRKAYYESAEWAKTQNRDKIAILRKETKDLRKKLSDTLAADDHVINKAFQDKPVERASMKNKTGSHAIHVMDLKVRDQEKRLNGLRHQTNKRMQQLDDLKLRHHELVSDASGAVALDEGFSEDAERLRNIENRLDKALLKTQEAETIRRTYLQIQSKLEEEAMNYPNRLNALEADIRRAQVEIRDLKQMSVDAQLSRDIAQADLKKNEEIVYVERKNRETELTAKKREAEEKKMLHERIERRLQRQGSIVQEIQDGGDVRSDDGEGQGKISTYEQAFAKIKEATGVTDTMEVVHRFENQGETQIHLERLKHDAEQTISRLTDELERLQKQYQDMKYTGESKLSSGQRLLEEFEDYLAKEESRMGHSQDVLKKHSKILLDVKAGVEHLSEKLKNIKAAKAHVPAAQVSATSDEYVLDLLSVSEEKLLKLLEELQGQDLDSIKRELEDEEFNAAESQLSANNTRIKLPATQKDAFADEDDSGDDVGDVMSREKIKKQAQQLIDMKTKRRAVKKKKKK